MEEKVAMLLVVRSVEVVEQVEAGAGVEAVDRVVVVDRSCSFTPLCLALEQSPLWVEQEVQRARSERVA
jgi:hypothetical protein